MFLKTNSRPAFKLSTIGSPIFLFRIGFLLIKKVKAKESITKTKTKQRVISTPIKLIKKPPERAPDTDAVFQVLVLHVAAF